MLLANNDVVNKIKSFDINKISADLYDKFEAGIAQDAQNRSRVLNVSGSTATIKVEGVLTHSYSFMTWIMGGTSYKDIMNAMQLCEADTDIDEIIIEMNSGGGQVSGLFDLIAQMQSMTKGIKCYISGNVLLCCLRNSFTM